MLYAGLVILSILELIRIVKFNKIVKDLNETRKILNETRSVVATHEKSVKTLEKTLLKR